MLGDIHSGTEKPFENSVFNKGNTHATYVTNLSIWPHNPLSEVESAMVGQHPLNFLFHELPIVWVNEVQIFFYCWRLLAWMKAVNVEQLGRPIIESSNIECPATHMSEALSFAQINPGSLQGFLCAFSVCDVLDRTEHFIRPSRCVSLQIA